jgi:hypothetical protein
MGLKSESQEADGEGRRAADAGLPRRQPGRGLPPAGSRRDRLPGADQGLGRRRRQGHARGVDKSEDFAEALASPARGGVVLRRPARADREVPAAPAPHRDPGLRRQPRQLRVPVRARLLGAAPPPEGAGRGAGARHDARAPRGDGQGRGRCGQGRRLCRRRHGRVHRQPGRHLLLHGDEHAAAGRASGDRDDHRPRPRRVAAQSGRRRAAAAGARSSWRSAAMRWKRASTPRIPTRASCPPSAS